jgi:AcrR family transcriptional regulator
VARRQQIVEAAITTIAEVGYARASFALIAQRAGLSSTGLISYHFRDKGDLVSEVVATIFHEIEQFMAQQLGQPRTATEALHCYIAANVQFIGAHRAQMQALLDIVLHGGLAYDAPMEHTVRAPLEQILRWGQERGEFRPFDARVVATVVQRSIDGLPLLLATDPDLEAATYGREVARLFDLGTRATR